ncbi:hypothetical protein [Terrabacter sp. MAHUQ-38]|uniref:hypothetical protein n=1 Tax=unclassified Terrabacter TaxID=2630222 RepID=UPI00165EAF68|nr:hypothetical protein [Terrabacter sp. MAHUQ-38]MBC9822872.1 hypothetical protein [Terrabacter sp. MAHUQ-38]
MAAMVLAVALWQALTEPSTEPATTSESSSSSTRAPAATSAGPSTLPPTADPTVPSSGASNPDDATATPSVSPSAIATGPTTGTAAPAVPAGAQEAASGLVTAWARPTLPAEQWLAGVRGYLTPDLERSMAYTDPSRIPASKVAGPATMVHVAPDGTAASFEVPTNAGAIRVEVVQIKGRWLATDIVPAAVTVPGD